MSESQQMAIPPGHIAVPTYGPIRHETAMALMDMRSFSERNGLLNAHWGTIPGILADKARNEAVRAMLAVKDSDWLCMVDGDMVFPPDSLLLLLQAAYGSMPFIDAIGAYCPLRANLALPTIDTGTGTWESHYPGEGILEVIRTGGAFLLIKRRVFERLPQPWFATRVPTRPIDFLADLDNWARIKFDGRNPLRDRPDQAWERLEQCARDDPSIAPGTFVPAEVGEDSAFSDSMRNAGMRLFVHTDVVCGHVDTRVISWQSHKMEMENIERTRRWAIGVTV